MNPTITYTPTNTANFGESGDAVREYQKNLNIQNKDRAGWTPLLEDGKYGPQTLAGSKFGINSSPIVSTGDIHREARTNSTALDNALRSFNLGGSTTTNTQNTNGIDNTDPTVDSTSNDPYVKMLNDLSTRSNDSTKMLISNIQASRDRNANKVNEEYGNYEKGLQLLGVQQNKAQSSPDLLMGQIKQAENQHMEKISALDAEESKALMDAENARADNDFKVLKEKMDYVKQLKKDKADALKELHTSLSDNSKSAAIEAHEIYDTLHTLADADKEQFLIAVSQKFNLPLGSLTQALVDEKTKREKITSKGGKGTGSKTGTGKISTAQVVAGQQKLDSKRGSDGYTDPYLYLDAYKDWTAKGGTVKQFISSFPANGKGGYINPSSYGLLPESIRPKVIKNTSGGSTTKKKS